MIHENPEKLEDGTSRKSCPISSSHKVSLNSACDAEMGGEMTGKWQDTPELSQFDVLLTGDSS
jgi:hypothetical protein